MKKKLALVVGARPNFMKAAPLVREIEKHSDKLESCLIHTGQHYDDKLSQLFFDELKMPRPDVYMGVGSGSHAEQTAKIMVGLEKALMEYTPNLVVVFGDVNSTLAASIVAKKLNMKLAHVEAGLRSFDNTMPEEINRIVTDRLSDYLFVTEESGLKHLHAEGIPDEKVFFTGNIMIDSLVSNLESCKRVSILDTLSLRSGEYAVMTMHRPSNVDDREILARLLETVTDIGRKVPVIFPCHPRTRKEMEASDMAAKIDKRALRVIDPLGYLEFLRLQSEARFVLTDSGGIQEETTYLNIPCVTLRENTERPVTVEVGSNTICGTDTEKITTTVEQILNGRRKQGRCPELWDGNTAGRIVNVLLEKL